MLSPPQVRDGPVSIQKPQQAQETDEHNLSEEGIAVDKESDEAEHHGRLDQIKNSHTTLSNLLTGQRRLCARIPHKPAV